MANAVEQRIIFNGHRRHTVIVNGTLDGALSQTVIVDKSTLTLNDGVTEPKSLRVDSIDWACRGAVVHVKWDHTTDISIAECVGFGYSTFKCDGGFNDVGTGGTGDIIITSDLTDTTAAFKLVLQCTLKD